MCVCGQWTQIVIKSLLTVLGLETPPLSSDWSPRALGEVKIRQQPSSNHQTKYFYTESLQLNYAGFQHFISPLTRIIIQCFLKLLSWEKNINSDQSPTTFLECSRHYIWYFHLTREGEKITRQVVTELSTLWGSRWSLMLNTLLLSLPSFLISINFLLHKTPSKVQQLKTS